MRLTLMAWLPLVAEEKVSDLTCLLKPHSVNCIVRFLVPSGESATVVSTPAAAVTVTTAGKFTVIVGGVVSDALQPPWLSADWPSTSIQ